MGTGGVSGWTGDPAGGNRSKRSAPVKALDCTALRHQRSGAAPVRRWVDTSVPPDHHQLSGEWLAGTPRWARRHGAHRSHTKRLATSSVCLSLRATRAQTLTRKPAQYAHTRGVHHMVACAPPAPRATHGDKQKQNRPRKTKTHASANVLSVRTMGWENTTDTTMARRTRRNFILVWARWFGYKVVFKCLSAGSHQTRMIRKRVHADPAFIRSRTCPCPPCRPPAPACPHPRSCPRWRRATRAPPPGRGW